MSSQGTSSAIARRGLLFVLSSPSGAGKTTLSRQLLARESDMVMSVSVTTRKPRPGETDGKDYHFISRAQFDQMVKDGELLEYAEVFGNGYGTPIKPVNDWLAEGKDVLFDIDWQGTQQIHARMTDDLVRVFILPPSAEELRDRLVRRAQDAASVVAKRMAEASNEISHWAEYDYVLINDDLDQCDRSISKILDAERLRRHRRVGLDTFVKRLRKHL
ncbi:guanylate kinase [Anderseniella sp. Alg231-50]|uniref:guanylate kinase n=1 Tax=Anderseniella sp. Alg231-50 TaxID=1922226 RepID=UPI000D556BBE